MPKRAAVLILGALLIAGCGGEPEQEPPKPAKPIVKPQPPAPGKTEPAASESTKKTEPEKKPEPAQEPAPPALLRPDLPTLTKFAADLKSDEPKIRLRAAAQLAEWGPESAPILPTLVGYLREGNQSLTLLVSQVMSAIGPASVPTLVESLKDPQPSNRIQAILAIREFGPKAEAAVPALVAKLGGADGMVTRFAIDALVSIGKPAVPALIELLKGTMPQRQDASIILAAIGPAAKDALPALKAAAADKPPSSFEAIAYSKISAATTPLDQMAAQLNSGDPAVRAETLRQLQIMFPKSDEAARIVVEAFLKDPENRALRESVQHAGSRGYVPLVRGLKASDPKAANAAADLLVRGRLPATAVPDLREIVRTTPSPEMRISVLQMLTAIGPPAAPALPDALPFLASPDGELRRAAMGFLGASGSQDAVEPLSKWLKHPNVHNRLAAINAFQALGAAAAPARQALEAVAREDEHPDIRDKAEQILQRLKKD